ncbi:hypothetical protein BTA51_28705 [Hahella sp. CCB-MM4]|uniref:hypothetical protein n=1 Tax=Hahella sp. (strain CCB-MM4) TaxID=1926491 RepID=UPI000B9BD6A5|nr:hypothetical protein [Hahella sp. CCB-MM4]OZG69918.1 hypothetical protein BTA51_28705 [Hahella sp. CCB-MM4]
MNGSVREVLVAYALKEISFWDVMAWANQINDEDVFHVAALEQLRYIDEVEADQTQIEKNLLSLLSCSNEETLSKLLFQEHISRVSSKRISSSDFVKFITQSVYDYESDVSESICEEIYQIFNYYNGFGFADLSAMENDELVLEINNFISRQIT